MDLVNWLKKYWLEVLVFGILAAVLLKDVNPAWTWMNTDSDGVHYTFASKFMFLAHNTSAPLFLLLGRLFLFIPYGHEAWRFGLLLASSTVVASILIYKIVRFHIKDNPKQRYYALIASLIYGGSALVISQSAIIDTYAFDMMLGLFAYYFVIQKKWILSSAFIGLLWASHTLFAWMIWAPILIQYRPMRDRVNIFVALLGFLFYLYIPIVVIFNHAPNMWNNATIKGFFTGTSGVLSMLTGQISMYDLPKRILDTAGMLGVSLGLGSIILVWALLKTRVEKALVWLALIPVAYFATNLSAETYVYLIPTVAFGAIITAIALSKIKNAWSYATVALALGLLVFNANYFDIGNHLDPNLSAMEFYNVELPKIPDGQIFLGGRWNWAMVYMYNKENNRHIIPVSTDSLPSDDYLNDLLAQGIKLTKSTSTNQVDKQYENALSIATMNKGVWIVKDTDPSTYGAEVVPAQGNERLLSQWIGHTVTPEWRWKPSNPWKFLDGSLEVSEWTFVLRSNRNALFLIGFGSIGWILNSWMFKRLKPKKVRVPIKEVAGC